MHDASSPTPGGRLQNNLPPGSVYTLQKIESLDEAKHHLGHRSPNPKPTIFMLASASVFRLNAIPVFYFGRFRLNPL